MKYDFSKIDVIVKLTKINNSSTLHSHSMKDFEMPVQNW